VELALMKNGISHSEIKKMSEKEVMEYFSIIEESALYEKEQIDMMKVNI
jgi:hypothetical protein